MANFISLNADKIEKTALNAIKLAIDNGAEDILNENHLKDIKNKIQELSQLEIDAVKECELAKDFPCHGINTFSADYKRALDDYRNNYKPSTTTVRLERFNQGIEDLLFAHDSQSQNNNEQNRTLDLDRPKGSDSGFTMFTIDPITKRFLVNPVRSKICQHVYEKDSIEEAIRMNPRLKCPYIACKSSSLIKINDLFEDRELKRKLMAMNLEKENQPMDCDDDDDD